MTFFSETQCSTNKYSVATTDLTAQTT